MQLVINPQGIVQCLYGETIDLAALGSLAITRASHVEPDADGCWWACSRWYSDRSQPNRKTTSVVVDVENFHWHFLLVQGELELTSDTPQS
jgi:hypothetical protein